MSVAFEGVCIGGPADGQRVKCSQGTYRMVTARRPPLDLFGDRVCSSLNPIREEHRYYYLNLAGGIDANIFVYEKCSTEQALVELVRRYPIASHIP